MPSVWKNRIQQGEGVQVENINGFIQHAIKTNGPVRSAQLTKLIYADQTTPASA